MHHLTPPDHGPFLVPTTRTPSSSSPTPNDASLRPILHPYRASSLGPLTPENPFQLPKTWQTLSFHPHPKPNPLIIKHHAFPLLLQISRFLTVLSGFRTVFIRQMTKIDKFTPAFFLNSPPFPCKILQISLPASSIVLITSPPLHSSLESSSLVSCVFNAASQSGFHRPLEPPPHHGLAPPVRSSDPSPRCSAHGRC